MQSWCQASVLNNTWLADVLIVHTKNYHMLLAYPEEPLLPKFSKVHLAYMSLNYFKQSEGLSIKLFIFVLTPTPTTK